MTSPKVRAVAHTSADRSDRQAAVDVTVVVVSYRTREITLECLRSFVAELGSLTADLIVVDNASPDGSAAAIAELFAGVSSPGITTTLHALHENVGFGAACNFGAESARGRYVLMLNPDTVTLRGGVERLVRFADAHPGARMWGGRTLHEDGALNPASAWAQPTPWSSLSCALGLASLFPNSPLFNPEGYGGWDRDSVREVDIVSGCFMLVEADLWRDLGGFHPDFWMYGEDADISLRARASHGARPTIDPSSEIVHIGGASESVREDQMVRLFSGKAQLYAKFSGPFAGRFELYCLDLWALVRAALLTPASLIVRGKRPSARAWRGILARRREWHAAFERTGRYDSSVREASRARSGRPSRPTGDSGPRGRRRLLAVASAGGHWAELIRLRPLFDEYDVTYVTTHAGYASEVQGRPFRTVTEASRWDKLRLMRSALKIAWLLVRLRPGAVVTTGAAPGWFALYFGKKLGAKTVWIDSLANGEELSMSGQRAAKHADLWLTQWPELAQEGGPEYAGSVL
ncbi:Glycosyl transferase family 2 [Planctomycetes bacterium Poly30]|uniref:Glycosyl transferase family 2 n=1 Tax=Saltatorellus ferox TaxID=2528018 RepID=A0A518EQK4_9BACT|nr:Glycosyl transferase family 2 [Planctomycetes bacterium Poly30]